MLSGSLAVDCKSMARHASRCGDGKAVILEHDVIAPARA